MLNEEILKKLLSVAVHAPSGDNAQPWRFIVANNTIELYNIPDKDQSIYNFRQRGSYIAHGAILQNITLLAKQLGLKLEVNLFPRTLKRSQNPVAEIKFSETFPQAEPLIPYIEERATNRKAYRNIPLQHEHKSILLDAAKGYNNIELRLIEETRIKKNLAKVLSLNERLLLENRNIHDVLFSHIIWSQEDEKRTQRGLFLKTLELDRAQTVFFRLFRHWGILQIFNLFKFSRLIARVAAQRNNAASALGLIYISNSAREENFVYAGMLFQKIWLKATQLGLSIHPVAAIPYLIQRVLSQPAPELSNHQIEMIKVASETIYDLVHVQPENIAMIFRIGYDDKPSARSKKAPPLITKSL